MGLPSCSPVSATIDPTGLDDAAGRLGLNELEAAVLGVVAAPELDARYARLPVTPRMLAALCRPRRWARSHPGRR